jgi:TonB family protein
VLASAPAGVFEAAALAAVREWRFEPPPAARSGLRLPLLFALDPKTWAEQMSRSENGR